MRATPDQVLAVISAAIGGAITLAAGYSAWRWWNRPTAVRRRQVARDVRALERGVR